MAFTPDEEDLEYSLDGLPDLEFNMEEAIGHVFNHEYILIVGSEVILKPTVEPSGDVNDYLLRHINQQLGRKYGNFDDVILHSGNDIDPIRKLLSWEKFKQSMVVSDVSEELQGLLRTKLFKVVITTTFDSYVEILMREIWGQDEDGKDNFRKVNIWDEESVAAFKDALKKYKDPKDYNEPTIIYAFGKFEEQKELTFARKDFEYIQTIERWMKLDNRSNIIMEFIKSKRILSLGCKFDNWYFRFFWYILKRKEEKQCEGDIAISLDKNDRSDQKLEKYLRNSRVIMTDQKPREFMRLITEALTSTEPTNPYHALVTRYRRRGKIFFSYCKEDEALAREIFQQLSPLYPNLWFDREIILGGENYDEDIRIGINNAQVFIPLLTPNIADDLKNGSTDHYYIDEWRQAAKRQNELAVIPLAVGDFSPQKGYYKKFETFFGHVIACVEQRDKLPKAIDKHLNS